jgi:hypothetical protein
MVRRRAFLFAGLALAIPVPAVALTSGEGESELSVEASLARCGVNGPQIVCEIETSFGSVDGAEYYTASVAGPDGGVTDFGRIAGAGGGGTSLWVPYVGNGTYSVTVTAWGDAESGDPEVLDRDKASAAGETRETEKLRNRDATEAGEATHEVPEDAQPSEQPGGAAEQPAEVPPAPGCEPAEEEAPSPSAGEGETAAAETDAAATEEVAPSVAPSTPDCPPAEPEPEPAPPAP